MQDIVLLNGSPRAGGSTSRKLLDLFMKQLSADCKGTVIEVGKSILHKTQLQDYTHMERAETIVIAFPLYVYCLPGALTEFLLGYREYMNNGGKPATQKIYAVINCGFPESCINNDAALVIKRFCEEIHATYRFSVLIGTGGMLQPLKMMPSVNKMWKNFGSAFNQIICDMRDKKVSADIHIDSRLPKKLFYFIGQTNFTMIAKKNGINRKEILRKPYLLGESPAKG
jgi:hypothetical protein